MYIYLYENNLRLWAWQW